MGWIPTRTLYFYPMKIYLAGPDVFLKNAVAVLKHKSSILQEAGYEVVTPLDNLLDNPYDIYVSNIKLIEQSDIVVANVEPFRGTEPDSGTVFEIGYAAALGKEIYTYNNPANSYLNRLVASDATSGQTRFTPEPFGLKQNLMLSCACASTLEFETFYELVSHLQSRRNSSP